MRAAAEGCDAILVAASPRIMQSVTVEDRARTYRDVLVASCECAAAACDRVVFISSISVYGDGTQATGDLLDEDIPRTTSDEPSSVYFGMAEDAALASGRGTVLRLADVHGHPRDIDYTARVRMVHEHMGGSTSFSGAGKLHRVHVDDVARAVLYVLENDLYGTYNCVPDLVPAPTNQEAFDLLADRAGLPRIEFRDELRTPDPAGQQRQAPRDRLRVRAPRRRAELTRRAERRPGREPRDPGAGQYAEAERPRGRSVAPATKEPGSPEPEMRRHPTAGSSDAGTAPPGPRSGGGRDARSAATSLERQTAQPRREQRTARAPVRRPA